MDPLKTAPTTQETKLHFLDYWRIIRIRKTVILAVFLLVVITATLVTFVLPETFASTARIKVERDTPDVSGLVQSSYPMGGYDPYFIQTEFEVIQSEAILGEVIKALNLNSEWGKKLAGGDTLKTPETLQILRGRMDLRPVRNTSLIEIRVFSEKAQEASDIANAIAEAYQKHRLAERQRQSLGGIEALELRFNEQSNKVAQVSQEVERIRTEKKIPDAVAYADAPTMLMTSETLRKVEAQRIEQKAELDRQETLLKKLKEHLDKLGPEGLAQMLPTAVQDGLLQDLLQQLSYADLKLVAASKDYGLEHPEVLKAKEQVQILHQKITERVKGIMNALDARVDGLRTSLANMQKAVEDAQSEDLAKAAESRPYFEKKRELEELQRFRQLLMVKIASERIDVALPRTTMVAIIDKATPALRPAKPNKPLNIALGIIIGLVVGVGLAFFIEYLDTSVKTIDDVERALQAPVLGVIPQNVGLMIDEGIESPHAEAYRVLRTNLLFSRKDDKLNSFAVVSAGAGEGKSTTVFNLAATFAQNGHRVVIVDSDLRRPTLHKILHVTNSLGLTNYLLKQNTLEEVIQTTSVPTLDFLASGKLPSSSMGILSSTQMRELIGELKQRYDFVFFDSPPIMGVSDASILASGVDMTIQVIQYRRYPQPMNIRAKQLIEKVGGNLVGIVLNNINMSQDESYYYYSGYYHDYYYSHRDDSEGTPKGDPKAKPTDKAEKTEGDKTKLDIKQKY